MAALPPNLAERLLDGSPDAILICDPAGIVRYWNAAAERIFGFPANEALGLSMNLIIPERFRARHWAAWEATMRTGITRYGGGQLLAVPALHQDGRQISIEFSIQLVKDAGGVIGTKQDSRPKAASEQGRSSASRYRRRRDRRLWSALTAAFKRNALESAAQELTVSEESRDSIREGNRKKRALFDVVRL